MNSVPCGALFLCGTLISCLRMIITEKGCAAVWVTQPSFLISMSTRLQYAVSRPHWVHPAVAADSLQPADQYARPADPLQ